MREYTTEYGKAGEAESVDPRAGLIPLIEERNLAQLLRISAQLHGHFCPGLSLGVMAAVEALHDFTGLIGLTVSDLMKAEGLEELLAIVETNNCMTDGAQAVSGEASFAVRKASSEIFSFEEVEIDVPGYAEMQENRICNRCGETVMAGRAVGPAGTPGMAGSGLVEWSCIPCAASSFYRLTGNGIEEVSVHNYQQYTKRTVGDVESAGEEQGS